MKSVSILTLSNYIQERETDLSIDLSSFEHEKARAENAEKNLESTKEKILDRMKNDLQYKIDKYSYTQHHLYVDLQKIAKNTIKSKTNCKIINNNKQLIKKINSIIKVAEKLDTSYDEAIDSLEKLLEHLINNCGSSGYLELNQCIEFLPKSSNNMELVKNAEVAQNEAKDEKEQKALKKLIDFIKVDNDFWDEIKKVELMIKDFKKQKNNLPKIIAARRNEIFKYESKSEDLKLKNENIKTEIENLRNEIDDIINNQCPFQPSYYDGKIEEMNSAIEKNRLKINKHELYIEQDKVALNKAFEKRAAFKAKGEKFNKKTSPQCIDKHNEKVRKNENWIKSRNQNIEKNKDIISNCQNKITALNLKIKNLKRDKQIAKAWEEFKSAFLKDYNNLEADVEKYFSEELKAYGY